MDDALARVGLLVAPLEVEKQTSADYHDGTNATRKRVSNITSQETRFITLTR